jgi:hypothetical protein
MLIAVVTCISPIEPKVVVSNTTEADGTVREIFARGAHIMAKSAVCIGSQSNILSWVIIIKTLTSSTWTCSCTDVGS